MTDEVKIALVKNMTEETDEEVISAYLSMAAESIYNFCDPYKTMDAEKVMERYGGTQARLTAYWLNKRGAEGQTSHNENGISRAYESGDIPDSLIRELTPVCGVVS